MNKYYAHADSVRPESKQFDYFVEVYLASAVDARIAELKAALREAMEWNWLDDTPHGQVPENVVEQCNKALGL